MQDSTALAMEQMFVKSHQLGLANADRENAGHANIAEQTRLGFLITSSMSGLAADILGQRSAGGQPQSGAVTAGVGTAKA